MDIAEVQDKESLERYLDALPEDERRAVAVRVAYRMAARVLPIAAQGFAENPALLKRDLTAVPIFGALAITAVAAVSPTAVIDWATTVAVAAAAAFANAAAAANANAANATAYANANAAAYAAAYAADAVASATAYAAAYTADVAAATVNVWRFVQADLSGQAGVKLWDEEAQPDKISAAWDAAKKALQADTKADWSFWIAWYERVLAGRDFLPDAMAPILNELREEDWEKGPAHINPMFDGVLELYRAQDEVARNELEAKTRQIINSTPYAMRVEAQGRSLVGRPLVHRDLSEVVADVRQGLKDFLYRCRKDTSPNKLGEQMISALDVSVKTLRRDFRRYKNDAGGLYDGIKATRQEMTGIATRERFNDANGFGRFVGILSDAEADICIAEPEVLTRQQKRTAVEVALFSNEEKLQAMRMTAGMALNSKGDLQAASRLALIHIIDPNVSEDEKKNAWYFVRAMIPRGAQVMKDEELKPASRSKAKDYIQKAAELGSDISKIDKGIDGLQEMSGEGADWLTETFTQIASGNWFGVLG